MRLNIWEEIDLAWLNHHFERRHTTGTAMPALCARGFQAAAPARQRATEQRTRHAAESKPEASRPEIFERLKKFLGKEYEPIETAKCRDRALSHRKARKSTYSVKDSGRSDGPGNRTELDLSNSPNASTPCWHTGTCDGALLP